jgi:hypothetical protein
VIAVLGRSALSSPVASVVGRASPAVACDRGGPARPELAHPFYDLGHCICGRYDRDDRSFETGQSAYGMCFAPRIGQKPQRPSREYGRPLLLVGSRKRRREHFLAALVTDGHGQDGDLVRRHRSEKVFGVLIAILRPDRVSG